MNKCIDCKYCDKEGLCTSNGDEECYGEAHKQGKAEAEEEHKKMCESCIHKVSKEDIEQIKADATRWIPVSERLPDQDDVIEIIACCSGKSGNITYDRAVVTDCYYEGNKWYIGGVYKPEVDVHAWMPLPEMYRGE